MGFCTQCGNQIPNTEKNCHYCGAVNEGYVPPKVEPKQAAKITMPDRKIIWKRKNLPD